MKSPVLRLLGTVCAVLWILVVADAIVPQFQMFLLGGHVRFPSVILKVVLLGVLVAAVPLNPEARIPRGIFWAWLAFASYLALIAIVFQYRFDYSLGDVLTTYSGYYYFSLVTPLFFYVAGTVPEGRIVRWLLVVLLPLAALGIMQQLLNDPILPTRSYEGRFEVNQWRWFGLTRGFSLASSGAQFGHYLSIGAALSTVMLFRTRRSSRILGGVFLLVTVAATFATLTRGAYLEVLLATITHATPALAAETSPGVDSTDRGAEPSVVQVPWPPADWTGWTVYHWDVANGIETPGLDATIAANRDPESAFGAMGVTAPLSHVHCSLAVSSATLSSGRLRAETSQHCSGVTSHRTIARFQRDSWRGWQAYSGWGESGSASNNQWLPLIWTIACGGGGTYNYRLQARPVFNSAQHGAQQGPLTAGGSTRQACGTSP
jgi:hypothetical protein